MKTLTSSRDAGKGGRLRAFANGLDVDLLTEQLVGVVSPFDERSAIKALLDAAEYLAVDIDLKLVKVILQAREVIDGHPC